MAPNAPSAHPVVSARAGSSGPTGIKAMAKGIASPAPLRHPKAGGSVRKFVFLIRREVHGSGRGRKEHHVHDRESCSR